MITKRRRRASESIFSDVITISRVPSKNTPLISDRLVIRGVFLLKNTYFPLQMTPKRQFFRRLRRARQSQTPFSNVSEHLGYFTIAFCHLYDSLKNVKVFQNIKKFYEVFYFSSDILILWFCLSAIGWRFPY